ncbi:hypothetical protein JCM8097_004089 [Rhodosporidiobolus ruineniae]
MASPRTMVEDSQSPEVPPTSLASSPSAPPAAAVSRPPANPAARPVKRTYGKRVEAEAPSTAAPVPSAPSRSLRRDETTFVPDSTVTDPALPCETNDSSPRRSKVASSSPTRRDVHSTDPTSEDEDAKNARSSSSSDEDEAADDKMAAFLKRGVKEMLADVEEEFDARADNLLPDPAATSRPFSALPALTAHASSSSLPHLTTSEPASSELTPIASSRLSTRRASPFSEATILDEIAAMLPVPPPLAADDDEEDTQPVVRRKGAARIADSEDEDEEEAPQPSRKGKQRAVVTSSDAEEEKEEESQEAGASSPVKSRSAPQPSAKERLAALAAKKRKELPVVEEPKRVYEDDEDMIDGDDESEDGGRRKERKSKKASARKSKARPLSKKVEEEMNKQTAALRRAADIRLAPMSKISKKTVTELMKEKEKEVVYMQESHLPTPRLTQPRQQSSSHTPSAHAASSTSDAIVTSSSPAPTSAKPGFSLFDKQRPSSPASDINATPVPRRTAVPLPSQPVNAAPAAADDDDDEDGDLLSLEEVLAKQKKEREAKEQAAQKLRDADAKRKKLQEAKLAAIRLAASTAADSDSDIEIMIEPAKPKAASSFSTKPRDVFEQVKNETPNRNARVQRVFRQFAGVDTTHAPDSDDEPTDSQLQAAGKEFGKNLDPKLHHVPTPAKRSSSSKKKRPSAGGVAPSIGRDELSLSLLHRAQQQNLKVRVKKATTYRQKQNAVQASSSSQGGELEGVDVAKMLEAKKQREAEDEQAEEDEDGDYQDGDEDYDDEDEAAMLSGSGGEGDEEEQGGSGSDAPRVGEDVEVAEEDDLDSEGELRMPPSSQNSDRFNGAARASQQQEQDDDDEESMMPPPPAKSAKKRTLFADDDEEEPQPSAAPAPTEMPATEIVASAAEAAPPAPARVDFGGLFGAAGGDDGGDGGFSQFFDSQFSQAAGGDDQIDGFLRPANADLDAPAPTMFVGQPLISTAEREADAARLEARGGFNDFEPGTPREAPAARQYINQQGFLTQTRPANLFDSPSDTPSTHRATLSTRFSESQLGGDTQPQTPTQFSKDQNKLRRLDAMVTYGSLPPTEVQPAATEVVASASNAGETQEETQEDSQLAFPSAAQPPTAAPATTPAPPAIRNAFDVLGKPVAAPAPPAAAALPKRKERSAFVDDQANLSDEEEIGLGAMSGDEDETGLDAELEELVDNQEVDREVRDEQDALAQELHDEEMKKQDEAALKRAQKIADGKERHKRKGYELSDDEFDDDYVSRQRNREKKQRVDMTVETLKANEDTQAFAAVLDDSLRAKSKSNEYSFLDAAEHSDLDEDDADDQAAAEERGEADVFGRIPVAVAGAIGAGGMSFRDAQAQAVAMQRERKARYDADLEDDDEDAAMRDAEDEDDYYGAGAGGGEAFKVHLGGRSSSPVAPVRLNNRIVNVEVQHKTTVVAAVDDYDELESQNSLFTHESYQTKVQYGIGDGREESQTAAVVGGRSAVTSFKRTAPAKTSSKTSSSASRGAGGKNGGGSGGGAALGPKASKLGSFRRGGFA